MKKIIAILFLLTVFSAKAQNNDIKQLGGKGENIILTDGDFDQAKRKKSKKSDKPSIYTYLRISQQLDTTYVDTTLNIKKDYKFNHLRKDDFELMPFANIGQPYNKLGYSFSSNSMLPQFGAVAKHENFYKVKDVHYYDVPTPVTELYYRTALTQGQAIDAFFTSNINRQLNVFIGYKGLRSLGIYQHSLTSMGNFQAGASYLSKNKRYNIRGHITAQDLNNEENGGLTNESVGFFEKGESDFLDRGVLEVQFQDAQSILDGKRTHFEQSYALIKNTEKKQGAVLELNHSFSLTDKTYRFTQSSQNDYFGTATLSNNIDDRVSLEQLENTLGAKYTNSILGAVGFKAHHINYNYGYDKIKVINGNILINRLQDDVFSTSGSYNNKIGKVNLFADAGVNVSGNLTGNFFNAKASYTLNKDVELVANLNNNSKSANFNQRLFQSSYNAYNWNNSFKNIKTQQLAFSIQSDKYLNLDVQTTAINDFVYFSENAVSNQVEAFQDNKQITYLKVKAQKEFKYRKFALNNTFQYQKVTSGEGILNVPEIVTRNTLYFTSPVFNKAMLLQTGVTFKYFKEYYANSYSPILSEFYVQNTQKIGGYPLIDVFVNARIRQTRLYLKAEHVNAAFSGRDYYSAPGYPYRDFKIRFGVVWNFFL